MLINVGKNKTLPGVVVFAGTSQARYMLPKDVEALCASVAYRTLQCQVEDLAKDLPGITLGYLGNCETWGDDRVWYVFLPHPGRVGRRDDAVRLGTALEIGSPTWPSWHLIEDVARRLYALEDRTPIADKEAAYDRAAKAGLL